MYHFSLLICYPCSLLNVPIKKHSKIALKSKLNFNSHVDRKIEKCKKTIGLTRRLSVNLLWNALLAIYKSIIRPPPDDSDILFDEANNENFQNKIEKAQYKACLAITGVIKGTSKEKSCD